MRAAVGHGIATWHPIPAAKYTMAISQTLGPRYDLVLRGRAHDVYRQGVPPAAEGRYGPIKLAWERQPASDCGPPENSALFHFLFPFRFGFGNGTAAVLSPSTLRAALPCFFVPGFELHDLVALLPALRRPSGGTAFGLLQQFVQSPLIFGVNGLLSSIPGRDGLYP